MIELQRAECRNCGFDFEKTFKKQEEGLQRFIIKSHYMNLLNIEVNPEADLICVCSNCRRMLYRRRDVVMDVEELKKFNQKK